MSKLEAIKFTNQWVKDLAYTDNARRYYRDALEQGFGVYITQNGCKTFYLRKRIKGRDERLIIGSASILTVDKARKLAREMKSQIEEGLDPVAERRKDLFRKLTFGAHCKDYIELYSKKHKKSWQHDQRDIDRFFSIWFHRRLNEISRFDVQKKYQQITEENGLFQANRTLERLKTIYNKAIEWGWQGDNPARNIKRHREKARERFIQPEEMPYLIQALTTEPSRTARDYFWMLLLTGVRKTNMLMMRWDEINWKRETWRIPDTKNGESLTLPLMDKAISILKDRLEQSSSEWVFPSELDSEKHFINVKRAWRRIVLRATIYQWYENDALKPIIDECQALLPKDNYNSYWMQLIRARAAKAGIELDTGLLDTRIHDIRRTFGSYQAINGTNMLVIGRSLGHRCEKSTRVYAKLSLDPVRASIKQATDVMLGVRPLTVLNSHE